MQTLEMTFSEFVQSCTIKGDTIKLPNGKIYPKPKSKSRRIYFLKQKYIYLKDEGKLTVFAQELREPEPLMG